MWMYFVVLHTVLLHFVMESRSWLYSACCVIAECWTNSPYCLSRLRDAGRMCCARLVTDSLCLRANTLLTYCEANRQVQCWNILQVCCITYTLPTCAQSYIFSISQLFCMLYHSSNVCDICSSFCFIFSVLTVISATRKPGKVMRIYYIIILFASVVGC